MYVNSESTNIEVNDQITNAETSFQRAIEDAELLLTAKVVTKNDVMDEVDVEVLSDLNPEPDDDIEEEGEKDDDDDLISEQHKEDSPSHRGRSSRCDSDKDNKGGKSSRDTSTTSKKPVKKKKRWCTVNLTACKYDCVRRSCRRFGMREVGDDEDWMLYWCDTSVSLQRVMEMKKYQKINHFPGMAEICRKDLLARNMNRMVKLFPKDYAIFPKSWCLPADFGDFQAYTRQKKNKTFILKPESGSQGKGIWICKNAKDIKPNEHAVCQQYVSKPLLVDGFKFDLRIYICVTSCDPLRIYVWRDGLARFATVKYVDPTSQNADEVFMHLTNYAINKTSKEFIRDEEHGSKRRLSTLYRQMQEQGVDVDKLKNDINDVMIKTLIAAHPVLKHNYRTCFANHIKGSACFEILGFDVLLDRKMRPIVLEVNHSPSFSTDSQLDRELKDNLVLDTLGLLNFSASDRKRCQEEERRRVQDRLLKTKSRDSRKQELDELLETTTQQMVKYELEHSSGYYRIYPPLPDSGLQESKYLKFFEHSGTLFSETVASKARGEAARQLREDLKSKVDTSPSHKDKNKQSAQHKSDGSVRPESPAGLTKKRILQRPVSQRLLQAKKRDGARSQSISRISNEVTPAGAADTMDTRTPLDISEEDILERQSVMLQRDNLVRSLGVVELVHRLLQSSQAPTGYPPVFKDKVESFREKYNLAQYGVGGPISAHRPPMMATGTTQIVAKNLPAPSLPHNLAARAKLMAFNKPRGTSVAGHYDRIGHSASSEDMMRQQQQHYQQHNGDNGSGGASGLMIKTNPSNNRFMLEARGPSLTGGANSASYQKYNVGGVQSGGGAAQLVAKGGGGLTGGDIISASFHAPHHSNNINRGPAIKVKAIQGTPCNPLEVHNSHGLAVVVPYSRAVSANLKPTKNSSNTTVLQTAVRIKSGGNYRNAQLARENCFVVRNSAKTN
ncbi:tubulin polyglutamylase ttll6-like isoform X2 [Symsagittifera roscoffensis]|uniref:tubulin polyglutamylase ttll6-like isoform X2 n=1 Tax=Symsagittifera roscoffensis TaxID=84072 RepID=UPI00307B8F30